MGTEGYKSSVKPMYVEVGVIQREKNAWSSCNYSSVSDAPEPIVVLSYNPSAESPLTEESKRPFAILSTNNLDQFQIYLFHVNFIICY